MSLVNKKIKKAKKKIVKKAKKKSVKKTKGLVKKAVKKKAEKVVKTDKKEILGGIEGKEHVAEPAEEVTDEELNNFFDDEYPEDSDYEHYPKEENKPFQEGFEEE